MNSMRVSDEILRPNRWRNPTNPPTSHFNSSATRSAIVTAANLLGCVTATRECLVLSAWCLVSDS